MDGSNNIVFGKLLYLIWHLYAIEEIFIVINGQTLNNNMATGHLLGSKSKAIR